jgi:hypothetical protein
MIKYVVVIVAIVGMTSPGYAFSCTRYAQNFEAGCIASGRTAAFKAKCPAKAAAVRENCLLTGSAQDNQNNFHGLTSDRTRLNRR